MKKSINLLFFYAVIFSPLNAQETPKREEKNNVSIGYGLAIKKNNRVGNTYKKGDSATIAQSIPLVQAKYDRFSLGAQGLAYRAYGNPFMGVSLFLNLGGERYEALGMQGRKKSLFLGTLLKFGKYSLMGSRDIGSKSEGMDWQISYNELFKVAEGLMLRTSVFTEWHDHKYARYYYGVTSAEATATRAAYDPGHFFTPGIGLMTIYQIRPDLSFLSGINLKYRPARMTDSPTVKNEPLNTGGFLGLSYQL